MVGRLSASCHPRIIDTQWLGVCLSSGCGPERHGKAAATGGVAVMGREKRDRLEWKNFWEPYRGHLR
jgi:hypothetical protein